MESKSHLIEEVDDATFVRRSSHSGNAKVQDAAAASIKKLLIASALCFTFMIGECVGGILANSLAILTDSAHLLSDLLGFAISIFAVVIGKRPASSKTSYGYHRSEVLGALASISLIWALTIILVYEAVQRVIHPEDVNGLIMLVTACCGFAINIVLTRVLHSHGHSHDHSHSHSHSHAGHEVSDLPTIDPHSLSVQEPESTPSHPVMNINVKAALIHVIGDLVQSVGVMIAAIVIYCKPTWTLADPICTFLFSILVVCTTVPILLECMNILLEQTPRHVDIVSLSEDLEGVHGVIEMHDLHVWSLSAGKTSMSCHLQSNSPSISLKKATKICKEKYNISHTTIQVEPMGDGEAVVDCSNSLH